FPLHMLISKLFSMMPAGEVFFRINLVSAVSAAAGYFFLIVCMPLLISDMRGGAETLEGGVFSAYFISAAAAGVLLFSSDVFMTHAVSTEIYTLNFLIIGILLFLFFSRAAFSNKRLDFLFFFFYGLSAGIHAAPFIAGTILSLFAVARVFRERKSLISTLPLYALFFFAGCCVILYLPAAALRQPLRNWGNPSDFQSLIRHLTAGRIRESFSGEIGFAGPETIYWNLNLFARSLFDRVYAILPIAFAGLFYLVRKERTPAFVLLLILIADMLFSVLINPMGIGDLQTGIISIYIIALLTFAGTFFICAKTAGMSFLPRTALKAAPFLLLYGAANASLNDSDRSKNYLPVVIGEKALNLAGNDSLMLTSSDDLSSIVMALQIAGGERPDVIHVVKQQINDVPHIRNLIQKHGKSKFGEDFAKEFDHDGDILPAERIVPLLEKLLANYEGKDAGFEIGEGFDRHFFERLKPGFPVFVYNSNIAEEADDMTPPDTPANGVISGYSAGTDEWGRFFLSEYLRHSAAYFEATGNSGAAVDALRAAIGLNPGNYRALNNLGVVLIHQGKTEEGLAKIREAVDIMPLYEKAKKNLVKYGK
ncbi:MAG: DUF2723 domain-containing protein, partial [Deltaproteobacteria bacterium]|nr:DUF2723 domain-containing protein [Deltaproteobacteria bacterium]